MSILRVPSESAGADDIIYRRRESAQSKISEGGQVIFYFIEASKSSWRINKLAVCHKSSHHNAACLEIIAH